MLIYTHICRGRCTTDSLNYCLRLGRNARQDCDETSADLLHSIVEILEHEKKLVCLDKCVQQDGSQHATILLGDEHDDLKLSSLEYSKSVKRSFW